MWWSQFTKLQRYLRERYLTLIKWPYSYLNPFFPVTRVHYAFDDFDNTECSADLFYRNTDIWTMGDVCPAPKIWVPYTPPDYSTYKHQSLPSYVRGKRASNGKECDRNTDQMSGCATIIYQYLAPFLTL